CPGADDQRARRPGDLDAPDGGQDVPLRRLEREALHVGGRRAHLRHLQGDARGPRARRLGQGRVHLAPGEDGASQGARRQGHRALPRRVHEPEVPAEGRVNGSRRAVGLCASVAASVALAILAGAAAGAGGDRNVWWLAAVGAGRVEPPGPGVPVTVIDSGIDLANPLFAGRPRTTALDPQTTSGTDEGHGTSVASVVVGVYPLVDLRVWDATPAPGAFSTAAVVGGLQAAAARGRGVVNLSLGGFAPDPLIERAIDLAFRSGVVVVASAGNDRGSGSRTTYPAASPH